MTNLVLVSEILIFLENSEIFMLKKGFLPQKYAFFSILIIFMANNMKSARKGTYIPNFILLC